MIGLSKNQNNIINKIIPAIFLLHILIISCKNNDSTSNVVKSVIETKSYNDTIIINSGIYLLSPNEREIDSLKKTMGEDAFYTVADDSNFYVSGITSRIKEKLTSVNFSNVNFKNENYILKSFKLLFC